MTRRAVASLLACLALVACSGEQGSVGPISGESVARDLGCRACHTEADSDLAPTWNGLWGSEVDLEDGSTVIVDETYVRKSIEDPQGDIVAGYGSSMPAIDMTEEEKAALIEYIESLG